jgi:hypothetical protein
MSTSLAGGGLAVVKLEHGVLMIVGAVAGVSYLEFGPVLCSAST